MSAFEFIVAGGAAAGWASLSVQVSAALRGRASSNRRRMAKAVQRSVFEAWKDGIRWGGMAGGEGRKSARIRELTPAETALLLNCPGLLLQAGEIPDGMKAEAVAWEASRTPFQRAASFIKAALRG